VLQQLVLLLLIMLLPMLMLMLSGQPGVADLSTRPRSAPRHNRRRSRWLRWTGHHSCLHWSRCCRPIRMRVAADAQAQQQQQEGHCDDQHGHSLRVQAWRRRHRSGQRQS
jgi:hypothetical protein